MGIFWRAKRVSQQAKFASGPFWRDARVSAQRSDHCDPRSMVVLTQCRHEVHLVVIHLPFPPCSHNWHTAESTTRCPALLPGTQRAWSVRARAASWSGNTQTTNTGPTCHTPAGFKEHFAPFIFEPVRPRKAIVPGLSATSLNNERRPHCLPLPGPESLPKVCQH